MTLRLVGIGIVVGSTACSTFNCRSTNTWKKIDAVHRHQSEQRTLVVWEWFAAAVSGWSPNCTCWRTWTIWAGAAAPTWIRTASSSTTFRRACICRTSGPSGWPAASSQVWMVTFATLTLSLSHSRFGRIMRSANHNRAEHWLIPVLIDCNRDCEPGIDGDSDEWRWSIVWPRRQRLMCVFAKGDKIRSDISVAKQALTRKQNKYGGGGVTVRGSCLLLFTICEYAWRVCSVNENISDYSSWWLLGHLRIIYNIYGLYTILVLNMWSMHGRDKKRIDNSKIDLIDESQIQTVIIFW